MATPIDVPAPAATATGLSSMAGRVEPRLPYSHRFGEQAPDEMPEIARELIMLRGAAASVQMKAAHVEEQMEAVINKLAPISDRREKPMGHEPAAEIEAAAIATAKRDAMEPVSDIGTDMRLIQKELSETTEYLERLGGRLWALCRDLTV